MKKSFYLSCFLSFFLLLSCNSVDDATRFKQVASNVLVFCKKGEIKRIENYIDENTIILEINAISDSLGYTNKNRSKTVFSYNTVNYNASAYFKNLHTSYKEFKSSKIISSYLENEKYHFFIATKTGDATEITEIILKIVEGKVKIYDYKSFTSGLSFREDFIQLALYNINESIALNNATRLLNKSVNLASRGDMKEALDTYNTIPKPYKYFKTFIQTKVDFVLRYGDVLTDDERFEVFDEWLSVNWENKGFRYYNLYDFYKDTEENAVAITYRDSLEQYIRKEKGLKRILY